MADPNLEDLAELSNPGGGSLDNPYAELLTAGAPLFLAKVSDSMRDVVGNLGRANRRIVQLEQQNESASTRYKLLSARITAISDLHSEDDQVWGGVNEVPGRCRHCKRKWPCKTQRILDGDYDDV